MRNMTGIPGIPTPRSQGWKSLSIEDQDHRLASLGLHLHRPERAIICVQCQYALQPSGERVSKHLWEKHTVPAEAREGLSIYIKHLQLPDPNRLPLRPDGHDPHPHLAVQPGAACKQCAYRSTSLQLVARHLSKEHHQKTGRKDWFRDGIRDNLRLQSWTQNGPREYWIVGPGEQTLLTPAAADGVAGSPRRRRRLAELHMEEQRRIAAADQRCSATDTGTDDLACTSSWMRRTGWATTFAGTDRVLLLLLADPPAARESCLKLGKYGAAEVHSSADDERQLVVVSQAVDRFFDRCENTARNTEHSIRCWLRSQIPGQPYKAPFELPGRGSTRVRYRSCWKRLLYFAFRLHRLDRSMREGFLGVQLSPRQHEAIQETWMALQLHSAKPTANTLNPLPVRQYPSPPGASLQVHSSPPSSTPSADDEWSMSDTGSSDEERASSVQYDSQGSDQADIQTDDHKETAVIQHGADDDQGTHHHGWEPEVFTAASWTDGRCPCSATWLDQHPH